MSVPMPLTETRPFRLPIASLRPRLWAAEWGQDGRRAAEANPCLSQAAYYAGLFHHMLAGGPIEPLKVGYWVAGEPGQIYVFDGHHRYAIARVLGWQSVPAVNAAAAAYPEARPVFDAEGRLCVQRLAALGG